MTLEAKILAPAGVRELIGHYDDAREWRTHEREMGELPDPRAPSITAYAEIDTLTFVFGDRPFAIIFKPRRASDILSGAPHPLDDPWSQIDTDAIEAVVALPRAKHDPVAA